MLPSQIALKKRSRSSKLRASVNRVFDRIAMKLHDFLDAHVDVILAEWDAFALKQEPAADSMTRLALRDHAREILRAIGIDIRTSQSAEEQRDKSEGHGLGDHPELSAASTHGALRQASSFSLLQLSAEYRALRASVFRLWLPHVSVMSGSTVAEITRFNESIDQALSESIITFSERADRTRDLFLAILGHDLRAPISTMALAGSLLTAPELTLDRAVQVGVRVKRSARVMSGMVEDLLGYTRAQLGAGMPVVLALVDVREICEGAIGDASAAYPDTDYQLHASGDLTGTFDNIRLHQLFTNVLVNAATYGDKGRPVVMKVWREEQTIFVDTVNEGHVIPKADWQVIFKPLVQLEDISADEDARPRTSLGLGLFVAREIASAHGGTIDVVSSEATGTTFMIRLPVEALSTPTVN